VSGPPWAALWTPSGRGAIATIRVAPDWASWPSLDALPFRAANGKPLSAQTVGRVLFGRWGTGTEEDVVVCPVDCQSLEIHCHGGAAAAQRILRDLAGAGCRVVDWLELLRQTESPLCAEILGELSRATTLQTAAILWEQANEVFESAVRDLASVAPADLESAAARIRAWLEWGEFGLHLTRPWRVVLAGRPNVGKSSLINALLGYTRSLVFDQPGTTRDVVSAATAIDGWPIELSDTAGLRESNDPLESAGIERARATLESADLPVILIDISQPASQSDRAMMARHPHALVVAHKCDLPTYEGPDGWLTSESRAWLRASSKSGAGVDALVAAISARLVPAVPPADTLVPMSVRQIALLQGALDAAERSDIAAVGQQLNELITGALVGGATGRPSDQDSGANAKGSPATS
jgi:tRNA modification GTPase